MTLSIPSPLEVGVSSVDDLVCKAVNISNVLVVFEVSALVLLMLTSISEDESDRFGFCMIASTLLVS